MRGKNRNSIASCLKLPQFTTMNVIDGQAGVIIYSSLICYSLTIDNILNIIVLLILAGVAIATLTGDNGLLTKAGNAKNATEHANLEEEVQLALVENEADKYLSSNSSIENKLKALKTRWYFRCDERTIIFIKRGKISYFLNFKRLRRK